MDPVTLTGASLGAVALSEGIKFLYNQAGEAIKWWVSRKRDGADDEPTREQDVVIQFPDVFDATEIRVKANPEAFKRLEPQIREYRRELADLADGLDVVDAGDEATLVRVDTLRTLLEAVYGTHMTFKGESRPASGTTLTGRVDVEELFGKATAVRLRLDSLRPGSNVFGEGKAKRVEAGGELFGIDTVT